MPLNNDLPDIVNPVKDRRNTETVTQFYHHLNSIRVELLQAPSLDELKGYIPRWGTATWNDQPHNFYTNEERENIIQDLFDGKILPSAMETIGLVFLISNMDLIDVTHLLRHRVMSFSAVCSADRDMRTDSCMLKPSIAKSKFKKRYMKLVEECKQLYSDMVDSDKISLLDARTILPRSMEQHYYCRVNLKDAIGFVKQRIDRQIQPESDNIIALQMWIEIVKKYPQVYNLIDVNAPDSWYIHTAPTGRSSNIYMPEKPRNDTFEYKEQWFIYKRERKEMSGGDEFIAIWNRLVKELEDVRNAS